jgi:hypothetical protein
MPTTVPGDYEISLRPVPTTVRGRVRLFFPAVAAVLFGVLLVGFAKTFFLRSLFEVPPIPAYLYVHGALLTTWYALVLAQTCLVAARRTDLHRRLGVAAVAVACVVVPISAYVVVRYVPRALARGRDLDFIRGLVVGDSLGLLLFAVLVAAGIFFRPRTDVHKRLMIASCFTIYGPVFARFDVVYGWFRVPDPLTAFLPLFVLGAYDLIVASRLHRATMWIAVLLVIVWFPLYGLLFFGGVADSFIRAVR